MSFAEWSNQKKKEREEKNPSQISPSPTKLSSEKKELISFEEWSNKKHSNAEAGGTKANTTSGQDGWQKYLDDQASTRQQEAEEKENESFWDKLGRWLGDTGATDTTLPMGNTGQIVHDVRNDTSYTKPSDDWSDDQRYEFGALYLESPEKAYAYAEKINKENAKAKEEDEIKKIQDSATSNIWAGAAHTAGAVVSSGLALADYLKMLVDSAAGKDPLESDGIVSPFEYSTAVQESIATGLNDAYGTLDENIPVIGGKGWGDVYGLGTSIAQSALSGYTLGPAGTLVSYFGQGAASGMEDALERGASESQAALYGAALGAFEGIAEQIGIDNLFKMGSASTLKGLLKNVVKQAGAEGLEEALTTFLSTMADDFIMQDKSQLNQLTAQYMSLGMSEEEAKKQAAKDIWEGLTFDALAGAISGGVHGGVQTGVQTGISNHYAEKYFGNQSQDIVNDALNSPISSVQEIGQKYQEKLNSGQTLSGWNLNELLEVTDTDKIQTAIQQRLESLGETGDVRGLAEILAKEQSGEELNKSERATLENSQFGRDVHYEIERRKLNKSDDTNKWMENVGTRRISPELYNKSEYVSEKTSEALPSTTQSTESKESKYKSSESGKTTLKGEAVSILGVESIKNGEITVRLKNGKAVNASDLEFGSHTEALMYDIVGRMEASARTANMILRTVKPSNEALARMYYNSLPLAYEYGKIGYEAGLKNVKLPLNVKNNVYTRGRIDAMLQARVNTPQTNSTQGGTNKTDSGIIYEDGFVYDETSANEMQRVSMAHIEVINKMTNLEVHVFESKVENGKRVAYVNGNLVSAPNGYFKDGNKIYIDFNAGNNGEGAMLYTMSHEITHYIREWNAKGFKELGDFLIEQYGKKGANVEYLLEQQRQKIKKRYAAEGKALPSEAKLNDMAYEEMVADAMSDMLTDPKAYEKLAKLKQQNRTLWEKVGEAIKAVLDKFKAALGVYKERDVAVAREANGVREFSSKAYEKLQDLYIKAFVEADANYEASEGGTKTTSEDAKHSDRDSQNDESKITAGMTEGERYEILKDKKITAPLYGGEADAFIAEELEGKTTSFAKKAIVTIANKLGIIGSEINFKDVSVKIVLSNSNLRESLSKKATPEQIAKLLPVLSPTAENSIVIERHDNRYYYDTDTVYFDNLFGAYVDGDNLIPVRFGLKHSKMGTTTLYVVVDQNKVALENLDEIKNDRGHQDASPTKEESNSLRHSVTYSISQIIPFVNSKDLLRYLPDGMLTKNQHAAKWEAIAETIKKTNEKNDKKYFEYIKKGNLIAATQMVLAAAKANGYTFEAWHGTRNAFTTFSKEKLGTNTRTEASKRWFFAADKTTANSYYPYGVIEALEGKEKAEKLKNKGNLYHLYLKMKNPLVVDVADYDYAAHRQNADAWMEYVEQAERDRNDGIILYNALDNQLDTKARASTVYMFSEPTQAKSADPVTYDDNGKVIPLSERFDAGNNDIRYSDRDSLGNELTKEQQEFFKDSKVRDENGNLKYLYHGTKHGGFTKFEVTDDIGYFFTDSEMNAASYSGTLGEFAPSNTAEDEIEALKYALYGEEKQANYAVYLNLTNPLIINGNGSHWSKVFDYYEGGKFVAYEDLTEEQKQRFIDNGYDEGYMGAFRAKSGRSHRVFDVANYRMIRSNKTRDWVKEAQNRGFDGVIFKNIVDSGSQWSSDAYESDVYVAFNSNQIKSVNNKTPTSDPDIRYSDRDSAYMDAYFDGDDDLMQQLVDEAAKEAGYTIKAYHGTNADFTVFDKNRVGKGNDQYGAGFYFASNPDVTEGYGTKRYDTYLDIKKPINLISKPGGKGKTLYDVRITQAQAYQILKRHPLMYDPENSPLGDFYDKYWEVGAKEWMVRDLAKNYDSIGLLDGDVILYRDYPNELHEAIRDVLGYDGVQVYFETDAMVDERNDYFYVAWFDNQMKSSDPVVRDDNGNVIPLSERFKADNNDIRYSDRDPNATSNRTILANALEAAAQNDLEKTKLNQYKRKIALIESEQARLKKIKASLKNLYFAKGPKDTAKIESLQESARMIENRINTYDRQLLNLEATEALRALLQREKQAAYNEAKKEGQEALRKQKEKNAATVKELMNRNTESRQKATESRNKTAVKAKIKKVVHDLNKLLLNPTKDQHVPIGLQKVVAEALDTINMDSMNAGERAAYYNELILKSSDPDEVAMLTKKRDFFAYRDANFKDRITELKNAYAEFKESDDPLIRNAHNDAIADLIKNTADEVGNKSLKDMSLSQLEQVYDMYKAILATVRNSNKLFKEGKQETVTENSDAVKLEVRSVGGHKDRVLKMTKFLKKFGWDMLKPLTAMKVIGSTTFERLFNNVRAAEDTWAVDVNEAKKYFDDIAAKYGYNKWDLKKYYTFKDSAGTNISLSLEQIMSLYAYSKREQADKHLEFGGFIFDDSIEVVEKNKLGIPLKYEVNDANPYRLRKEHLLDITNALTKEQKDFVDAMQTYLSDVMGAKGNEVSLAMYDIKLYKEKNYFPLKTSRYFREFDPEKNATPKIKNSGFSKKTVPQAGNPIVLSNFMDVWASHVNDMSMYHAFVLPLEDFMRVYNYSSTIGGYDSVQQYIKNAYGAQANQYIERLMDDLNGGARVDSSAGIINKGLSLFKKASVFASASVVVQQPSAIARALAYINPKYFVKATPEALNIAKHKALWAEVKKYAPVAVIKEMGYFDTGVGRSTVEWIKGNQTFKDKMDDVLSKAPALADELCWVHIWEAVKRETIATKKIKYGTEDFFNECGRRFTEVITNTQVYDSVLSRSGMMRSKDTGMKMATAFMAEPTTTVNMMVDGIIQGIRGNKKFTAATVGAVSASIILNSILVSLVYAARDDDEDETYLEKYIGSLTTELLDGFNPLTYIPFVKDIWSIAQGYDVERSDMSVISKLWESIESLFNEDKSGLDKVLEVAGSISSLFGIPLKNIIRDAKGMYSLTKTILSGVPTTEAGIGYAVEDAFKSSIPLWDRLHESDSKTDKLYDAIMSGDQNQINRVKATYKTEQKLETALKTALRENDSRIKRAAQARLDGNILEYARIAKEIIAEGHFSQDTVVGAINAEISAIKKAQLDPAEPTDDKDEVTSIYKADDFNVAFNNGDKALALSIIDDLVKTKVANGMDETKAKSSLRSSMTSFWKPLYLEAAKSGNKAEMQRIKQILFYSGLYGSAADVVKAVKGWTK